MLPLPKENSSINVNTCPPNALEFYFAFEMGQINYYFYIINIGILPVFSRSKIYCKPVSAKLSLAHIFLQLTFLVSFLFSFPLPNSFPLHLESCISFRYKTRVCQHCVLLNTKLCKYYKLTLFWITKSSQKHKF